MGGAALPVKDTARRPRDRGRQIALNARELFTAHGYHSVRMDQIAEASGITARALYRHYANKQALLSHVILEDQQRLVTALEQLAAADDAGSVEERLSTLAEVGLESRRLSVLWQREARHLDRDDFSLVRTRTRWIAEQVGRQVVAPAAPDLDDFATEVRSWAVVSILTSPAFYDSGLSRARLKKLLVEACERVIRVTGTAHSESGALAVPHLRTPASRREQLLAAAARAFRRNGYAGVSIDDIGAEVGVVGPAIYRYFDTKAGILVAATNRFYEWQALEVARALTRPARDADVFDALVTGYVRLAVRSIDLLAVSLTENHYLSEDDRDRFDRIREENTLEWQRWISATRDDLDEATALTLVHISKGIIHDLVRIPHLHREPTLASELTAAVTAVVHV
ncbi:TetR/AcrR family transcriptional regulator [Blastococcus sp. PRF04-17]|uniref:TetR/AcrR family transcriptional regulator n=1 Tax=Blastococcus sp. PRF04-17 TaxID=2933797 RepID=UPI001FF32597|nr:TetR/AcrR family transcriptional regulator [Blastococcus sp. PRF04-17]UOY03215.1 TetR/AcrR family transcriptional regulator [Blastococcus sp. PRF04-17]